MLILLGTKHKKFSKRSFLKEDKYLSLAFPFSSVTKSIKLQDENKVSQVEVVGTEIR